MWFQKITSDNDNEVNYCLNYGELYVVILGSYKLQINIEHNSLSTVLMSTD